MKITRLSEGKGLKTTEDDLTLSCPICGSLWLKEEGGYNVDDGSCKHLRFIWMTGLVSGAAPEFFGDWDKEIFIKQCLLELNRKSKEDGEEDHVEIPVIGDSDVVKEILKKMSSPDIDDVWEYVFFEEYHLGGGNTQEKRGQSDFY
ncbi:MAG: hypothetical protein V1893_00845 [Candidatus Omnitrophota bacterium]